jgi:chemotaxis protein methyltransferase CheR
MQQGQAPSPAPPWLIAGQPELSDREFADFCRLVHRHAGIYLAPQKKELVRARLVKLLRARGLASFGAYYRQVLDDRSGGELAQLLDAVSTNQTAFWREPAHFLYLSREILPLWRQQRVGGLRWRFWSAGCSSGEEPYTLAMVLLEALPANETKDVKIYASDLNTQVLAQARQGIYPEARVAPLPAEWRRRFFQKGVGQFHGQVRVKAQVRDLAQFFRLNLMEPFDFHGDLDLILCRNVMIYFDKQTQAAVMEKMYRSLKPGGFLFLGHSESLCNLRHRFTYVKPTVYRK